MKLRIQILKFSLIFDLIVQVILTLTKKMFAVWLYINTRSHSPRKNYQPLFTDYLIITSFEKNSNVKSVANSIPSRFLKFGSRCWKLHLHTGFNVYTEYRESSGGSQFVTKSFSMC